METSDLTMLTSLKAFLFPASAGPAAAPAADMSAGEGGFARLMGDMEAKAAMAATAPVSTPVSAPVGQDAAQADPAAEGDAAPLPGAEDASSSWPVPSWMTGTTPLASAAPAVVPAQPGDAQMADGIAAPVPDETAAHPVPHSMALAPQPETAMAADTDEATAPVDEDSGQQDADDADPLPAGDAAALAPVPMVVAPPMPSAPLQPPMAMEQPAPAAGETAPVAAMAGQDGAASPAPFVQDASRPPVQDEPVTESAPILPPAQQTEAEAAPVSRDVAARAAAPLRAEVVSLLQFARDHGAGRTARTADSAAGDSAPADAATPADTAAFRTTLPDMTAAPVAVAQSASRDMALPLAMPVTDLSASLGSQVIDMGVSGQWIDGLARDIAGLSANGAQGRFQIDAQQLGPIQVDIRQGDDGTAVSLTVATELAEQALRQDSDRLRLDAGLSAVRISDLRIERAVPSADAARADTQSQQQQAQGGSGGAGTGQGTGQSPSQSSAQGQGRWQSRENIALAHKGGGDATVLNHDQSGKGAARYA